MNTPNDTPDTRTIRPGFWLRAIEHRKHELAREYRRSLADVAREGITDEDYATTMATLEKMAVNLGWDDSQRDELRGHGFGARGHHGRGRGHGHRGFGPGHHDRRHEDLPNETPEA